jgi:hypothetical protein
MRWGSVLRMTGCKETGGTDWEASNEKATQQEEGKHAKTTQSTTFHRTVPTPTF